MQENNYVKNLTLSLEEALKEINVLKKRVKQTAFNTLNFKYSGVYKSYAVNCESNSSAVIEILNSTDDEAEFSVKVNGITADFSIDGKTFNVSLFKGNNEIVVSSSNSLTASVKISGYVKRIEDVGRIFPVKLNNSTLILYFNGKNVTVYTENFEVLSVLNGVKQGTVLAVKSEVEIAFIDLNDNLRFGVLNVFNGVFTDTVTYNVKANCVSGYKMGDIYYVVYSRLKEIKMSYVVKGVITNTVKLNVRGSVIYCDNLTDGVFITVDELNTGRINYYKNGKYVSFVIGSGKNFHVYGNDGGYDIYYYNGLLLRHAYFKNGRVLNDEIDGFYHEKVIINDVKYVREYDEIKILKE